MKRIMIWSMLLVDRAQRRFTGRGDVGANSFIRPPAGKIAVVGIVVLAFLGHSVNNQLENVANVINTDTTNGKPSVASCTPAQNAGRQP